MEQSFHFHVCTPKSHNGFSVRGHCYHIAKCHLAIPKFVAYSKMEAFFKSFI